MRRGPKIQVVTAPHDATPARTTAADAARAWRRPPAAGPGPEWFAALADVLLNGVLLRAGRARLRPCEVEAYYTGPGHEDPFAHADPVQAGCRVWYFHRRGGGYRGGSYKGLDLVFGPPEGKGGLLLRALESEAGALIDGPSLVVDHLLACTGEPTVAALDAAIAGRDAWDPRSPLRLEPALLPRREPLATARVGLTLKRAAAHPTMPAFVARPYRWLTRPRALKKGRPQTILALAAAGQDAAAIQALTGSPRRTVEAYLAAYAAGRRAASCDPLVGRSLSALDVCRLLGGRARAVERP